MILKQPKYISQLQNTEEWVFVGINFISKDQNVWGKKFTYNNEKWFSLQNSFEIPVLFEILFLRRQSWTPSVFRNLKRSMHAYQTNAILCC